MEEDDIVVELNLLASNIKKKTCFFSLGMFFFSNLKKVWWQKTHTIYAYIDVRWSITREDVFCDLIYD
jgi:hypothetical protein